jgi:hypothetical protein
VSLDAAGAVADAVLYEGYLLYPYRASAAKNQVRWQFGVLSPPGADAAGAGEPPDLSTEVLVAGGADTELDVRVRFLQLQPRTVERRDSRGEWTEVPELRCGAQRWIAWDEAVEVSRDVSGVRLPELLRRERTVPLWVAGGDDVEAVTDGAEAVGRLRRRRSALSAVLALSARPAAAPSRSVVLRASLRNTTGWDPTEGAEGARCASLLAAHLVVAVRGGGLVPLLDPPPDDAVAAAGCRQHRCWPVLVGPHGSTSTVLVSPIVLEDWPQVAPESAVQLFDATEIDEILTLRVLAMTDDEKAEARLTDPRAADLLDSVEALSETELTRLHGARRPPPGDEVVLVCGAPVRTGSAVRLRPSRRADAHDMFLAGRTARVAAVQRDYDGAVHVAVVVDDDPAADLHDWYGRYLYFGPEELEVLPEPAP